MSSLYQAESLGYDAYMDMKGKGENPYPNNTEEHEAWTCNISTCQCSAKVTRLLKVKTL
jgi:hypothetical protein